MKLLPFCLLVILGSVGCGGEKPKLVSVTGKVLDEKKQPVTAGSLYFHPEAGNSFQQDKPGSLLQLDGSFTIKTFPFGEGIPPGNYKVTLAPDLASRLKKPAYSKPETTPWVVTVPETGLAELILEVK